MKRKDTFAHGKPLKSVGLEVTEIMKRRKFGIFEKDSVGRDIPH